MRLSAFLSFICLTDSIRVLFSGFGSSHFLQLSPIISELLKNGHTVDVTIPAWFFHYSLVPLLDLGDEVPNLNLLDVPFIDMGALIETTTNLLHYPNLIAGGVYSHTIFNIRNCTKNAGHAAIDFYSEHNTQPDLIILDMMLTGGQQLAAPGVLTPIGTKHDIPMVTFHASRPSSFGNNKFLSDLRLSPGSFIGHDMTLTSLFDLFSRASATLIGEVVSRTIGASLVTDVKTEIADYALVKRWGISNAQERSKLVSQLVRPAFHAQEHFFTTPIVGVGIPEFNSVELPYVKYIGAPDAFRNTDATLLGSNSPFQQEIEEYLAFHSNENRPVAYVSFGTLIILEDFALHALLKHFSDPKLIQNDFAILWSIRGSQQAIEIIKNEHNCWAGFDPSPDSTPTCKTIRILERVNQRAILNHPAVRVFVSHAGYNSALEAVIAGKPLVLAPAYFDQISNTLEFSRQGFALPGERGVLRGEIDAINDLFEKTRRAVEPSLNSHMAKISTMFGRAVREQTDNKSTVRFLERCAESMIESTVMDDRVIWSCGIKIEKDIVQGFGKDIVSSFVRNTLGSWMAAQMATASVDVYLFTLTIITAVVTMFIYVISITFKSIWKVFFASSAASKTGEKNVDFKENSLLKNSSIHSTSVDAKISAPVSVINRKKNVKD